MKRNNTILITVLVLLLCMAFSAIGCNASKERAVLSMLRYIPEDANSFEFLNVDKVRGNNFFDFSEDDLEFDLGVYL